MQNNQLLTKSPVEFKENSENDVTNCDINVAQHVINIC